MKIIRFYKHRHIYFVISVCLILGSIVAYLINGLQLDIQFKGGTMLKYAYTGTIDADAAADVAEDTLGKTTTGQIQSNLATDEQILVLSLANDEAISAQDQAAVTAALDAAFSDNALSLSETQSVEPFIGVRFFKKGLFAIGLSFLLILIYVGFRFRNIGGISAGVMAIVALLHDTLIATAAFIVFKIPLNDSFIAVILTIIGFSINDTIVIYDRIRENERLYGSKLPVDEVVDMSISQSITRSVNTNLAVFLSITIVYIFAQIYDIESIKDFALPMMFGTVSGCYSTICIAGPLWTRWKLRGKKKAAA